MGINLRIKTRRIFARILHTPRPVVIVVVLVFFGIITLILTKAATPTTSVQPETGNKTSNVTVVPSSSASGGQAIRFGAASTLTCGKTVTNYTYQVPYGNAVWNQPVCNLPRYAKSAEYANRFYTWANMNDGSYEAQVLGKNGAPPTNGRVGTGFGLDDITNSFARTVYYARDATYQAQIWAANYESNLDGVKYSGSSDPDRMSFRPNATIPWNPAWDTGHGGDNEIVVLDESNGRIYEVSGYRKDPIQAFGLCGPLLGSRLCTYTVHVGRDQAGSVIDYRTYEGPHDGRGVGLGMYQTFTVPEEVKAGEIRHAMGMAIPNTSFGPVCTPAQQGTSAEGTTCGTAVAPASKFEWAGAPTPPIMPEPFKSMYGIDKSIPEGMRFALNLSYTQIDAWISSRPDLVANPAKAKTARTFARAFKDYGIIVADTSGAGVGIQIASSFNPVHKQLWAEAGIVNRGTDENLLDGLLKSANDVYVVEPPTQTCVNGTVSKYFCPWKSSHY